MGWERTIPVSDLPDGGRKVVTVDNKPVLLINHCNKVYAISSTCPHWGLPLELGRLTEDCGIICPWHRSGFDLDTGDVKAWAPWPPGLGLVLGATSRKKVLPTYPTKVEDSAIWVSLDAEPAVAAAPDAPVPTPVPIPDTPLSPAPRAVPAAADKSAPEGSTAASPLSPTPEEKSEPPISGAAPAPGASET
jgi:nitrite reductase/ring-hydroxylating ferredoxin subunit